MIKKMLFLAFSDFDKIGIPHINNALDGTFTDLKQNSEITTDSLKVGGKYL